MKWNTVTTPPEKAWGEYLTTNGYWFGVLTYKHGCWFNDLRKVDGITHWMPLPPKPGDESPSSDPAEVLVRALEKVLNPDYTQQQKQWAAEDALKQYEQLKQQ